MKNLLALILIFASNFSFSSTDLSEETMSFLKKNNITLVNEGISEEHIAEFRKSFDRFPSDLNDELLKRGRKLRLIYGHAVTDDPTFKGGMTGDDRSFSEVVGKGGSTHWGEPTRMVVNRLHAHGSIDLYLHEEAHSVDSTYGYFMISGKSAWKKLHKSTEVKAFLKDRKLNDYYTNRPEETFAELFAFYYASEESQAKLYRELPEVAHYFETLRSIKKASRGQGVSDFLNSLGF